MMIFEGYANFWATGYYKVPLDWIQQYIKEQEKQEQIKTQKNRKPL